MEEDDCIIYVVIHNIDGPGLRDSETQQYLARIASCSHIRVIASIDHVNAPLCKYSLAINARFVICSVLTLSAVSMLLIAEL